jgi:enoyl-[acyl-carrier protein] reductase/trans-2-enoyl-CoA reductase (NAD+)
MIIQPKVRGFVCVTAHPKGCAAHVQEQINYVKSQPPIKDGTKTALIIGASTGYGLSSRIAAAFGCGAATFGVFFERPSDKGRPASAGWYNTAAFQQAAHEAGLYAKSINGDAFSHEIKQAVVDQLKADKLKVDLVVYSLASPRRTDPDTGETYKSVLKPLGQSYTAKTVDTDRKLVHDITLEPASPEEVEHTRKVMGGEDWELWMEKLEAEGLLAPGATSVAYSYIGPEITHPIYRNGTIGKAKEDLERAGSRIDAMLKINRGRAFVSVNKAVVTQASSAIPVVPLYISILLKVMNEKGVGEGCIEQIHRLFAKQMYNGNFLDFDDDGRVRIDNLEMLPEVQEAVKAIWPTITTENLESLSDFALYQSEFLKLFGFGLPGIDYQAESEIEVGLEG